MWASKPSFAGSTPSAVCCRPWTSFPLAEDCGLILPIGDWGLAEACSQIRAWTEDNPENESLRVCVNLSARQFSREGLADHVESLLMQSGTSSSQLGLEMTESSLIPNMGTALEVLEGLRALGVSISMDDFGTGYSSLSYLHSFPIDVLKIDRSFVGRMTEGDQPLQIVRTIIELARVLEIDVVAEGIETAEQVPAVARAGLPLRAGLPVRQAHARRTGEHDVASSRPRTPHDRVAPARPGRLHGVRFPARHAVAGAAALCRKETRSPSDTRNPLTCQLAMSRTGPRGQVLVRGGRRSRR